MYLSHGVVDVTEGWETIERDGKPSGGPGQAQEVGHGSLMRFNKAKCKVLYLGQSGY